MLSYIWSMVWIFSRYSSGLWKSSCFSALGGLSLSNKFDLFFIVYDWFVTLDCSLRVTRFYCPKNICRVKCYSDRSSCMSLYQCHLLNTEAPLWFPTKIGKRILIGTLDSSCRTPLAHVNYELRYSQGLNCSTIEPCLFVVTFTQHWECGGTVSASTDLVTGVIPDAGLCPQD